MLLAQNGRQTCDWRQVGGCRKWLWFGQHICYAAIMEKESFEALFQQVVFGRLEPLGFFSKGKTISFYNDRLTISLIRLGGRKAFSGSIAHIFCFRHSFLRDMNEEIPKSPPSNVFSYPYKLKPYEDADRDLIYRPKNLNFDYERLHWEALGEAAIGQKLDRIAGFIGGRFLPWAEALTPEAARLELSQYGEGAWCERMWDEDYAARLVASS